MDNFIMPFMGHTLTITRTISDPNSSNHKSDSLGGELRERDQKLAIYGSGESNYYYQLQRFISDLQVLEDKHASRQSRKAVRAAMKADADDAIDNMTLIDNIYRAAGLPLRQPTSAFVGTAAEAKQLMPPSRLAISR
eukprot:GHUV01017797.1.p1 GENE.GHUV01017797.1~~GHUV01017797.1.p1  ORF type:complete len:137 (+),score=39.32 GHUV01017797.1:588-998(+)